ncbi:hypothetical protein ACFV2N_17270 [Streptomyces sp. NPDC059680]
MTGPEPNRQPDAIALDHATEEHHRPAPPPTATPGPARHGRQ